MKAALLFSTLSLIPVASVDVKAPDWMRWGENVNIGSPVHSDIYIAGGNVTVNAPVYGDLVVAGGTVIINDSVSMDVLVAGGTVNINGPVADDIRAAGGTVNLNSNVMGDVIIAGGELITDPASAIEGNLIASGGQISIAGTVNKDVRAMGGEFVFKGNIGGDLDARFEKMNIDGSVAGDTRMAATTIDLGPEAKLNGKVRYWDEAGSLDADAQGLEKGRWVFDPTLKVTGRSWVFLGFTSALMLLWYLGTALLMIGLIQYLFSRTLLKAAGIALQQSVKSIGFGFLLFVAAPVAAIISLATIVGVPIAIIIGFAYISLLVLATAITAVVISNWFNRIYGSSSWSFPKIVFAAFGIFILLKLITLTPVIGPLIMALMACMAIGSILLSVLPASKENNLQHA